jgi:glycosyltransferase involved in cell wall biosynthesis
VKVLQILDSYLGGGILTVVRPLIGKLAETGVRQALMVLGPRPREPLHIPGLADGDVAFVPPGCSRWAGVQHLRRFIRAQAPDVIHTHHYRGQFYLLFANRRPRIPVVAHIHGFEFRRQWRLKVYWALFRLALRHADRLVAVSRDVEQGLLRKGFPAEKVRLVYNACPVQAAGRPDREAMRRRFGLDGTHFAAGYLGRVVPGKRIDVMLEATARLVKQWPGFRFLVAGQGASEAALQARTRELGLGERVRFCGWVEDPFSFLAALDALVLLSDSEGLPVSLLEAMHVGLPLVVNRVGGIPEVVEDGVTGFVLEGLDPASVAERFLRLARDPGLRERLAREGQRLVAEKFSLEKQAAEMRRVYEELTAP